MCVSRRRTVACRSAGAASAAGVGALEDPWFPKARRDTRRRLAGIQAALLSQLLMRLVSGGQPAGEQQLSRQVPCGHSPDPLADPEPLQHPQAVRRQRHICAGLGPLLRLLTDLGVDPGPRQRKCRCPSRRGRRQPSPAVRGPAPCPTVEVFRRPGRPRPGPAPDHRAYAVAASRSANLAGCAMCGKCPLSAQTSTVACGAAFPNQAAVSGDGSEPRISR